ncbi:MAG: 2-phospho-L-lactate transferase CofD family protein, partial [Mangrovicoccus sp.]
PMRQLIQALLSNFAEQVPQGFDYRKASIGNLIIAGGYLENGRALEPVLFLMSKMVDVRGTVRVVVDANLQLGVELADGRHIVSQRLISGKEAPPITQPIRRCYLSDGAKELPRDAVSLPKRNRKLIGEADVICYPPGSLYSSVIANLLPEGVGAAVAARNAPKIYLPSLGTDPEAIGLELADQVAALVAPLQADFEASTGRKAPIGQFLTHVLCDKSHSEKSCRAVTEKHGIPCHRLNLEGAEAGKYDPEKVVEVLISLG